MPFNNVSLELLQSMLAGIDVYKGEFEDEAAIIQAHPTAANYNFAWNEDDETMWGWNPFLSTPAWVSTRIGITAYGALPDSAKKWGFYVVTVDPVP